MFVCAPVCKDHKGLTSYRLFDLALGPTQTSMSAFISVAYKSLFFFYFTSLLWLLFWGMRNRSVAMETKDLAVHRVSVSNGLR